jgi:hypothetical protein
VPTASVPPSPSSSIAPSTSPTGDVPTAVALLTQYREDINSGDYAAAWALLAPTAQQQGFGTLAAFTSEQTAYHQSTGNSYTLIPNPPDSLPVDQWLPVAQEPNLDRTHAVTIEVDYPALAGNNAGYEIYVVGPIGTNWFIFPVR